MGRPDLRVVLPVALILTGLFGGGWYIDHERSKARNVLSGTFESQPIQVASRIGGRVLRIPVTEGQAVQTGAPLIEFEAAPTAAETAARTATAEQARQQYREAANGPRREDINKQEAIVAELRANLLKLRNGPLPEEIAQARARLAQAEANYRKALDGPRPQEVAQAEAAERNIRARLAEAEHGPTTEERAQAKARLDAAVARETLAFADAERFAKLYALEAVTKQQYDQKVSDRQQAEAQTRDAEEALRRVQEGTRPEEIEQARQALAQAKAALALVRAGSRPEDIRAAGAEVDQARQALHLLERGTRPEEILAARARLEQALAVLAALQAGNRPEQVAQAAAAAKAAALQAESAKSNLTDRVLTAPTAVVVERVLVAVGDLVSAGTPVLRLDDPNDIWMRVYVPERDLARIVVGSDAGLRIDGIAEPITAVVESVATRGEFTPANLQTPEERGKQVFSVRLRLKRPDPRVKAGMSATVVRIGNWEPR